MTGLAPLRFPRAPPMHRPEAPVRVCAEGDELDGGDVLPGLRLRVAELFA